MAAFVMAYSFTEKSPNNDGSNDDDENAATAPTMVPMADILNHISKNNAHLEFGTESLTMVAIRNISKVMCAWKITTFYFLPVISSCRLKKKKREHNSQFNKCKYFLLAFTHFIIRIF